MGTVILILKQKIAMRGKSSNLANILKIVSIIYTIHISQACVSEGNPCNEDCDCCGNDQTPPVRCEKRNQDLGYQCYKSGQIGDPCIENSCCVSQFCSEGFCAPNPFPPPKLNLPLCPIDFETLATVNGDVTEEGCPCSTPDSPSVEDANNALDGDLNTVYVNNWAIGSGLEIKPLDLAPVRSLKVCSADDCPECDPTCYKLEGYCEEDNTYTVIQEGDIDLSIARNTCVDIPIAGHNLYTAYKITFPCIRGGFLPCSVDCVNSRCQSDPLKDPTGTPCPNNLGTQHLGRLTFMSNTYDGQDTVIQYSYNNIEAFNLDKMIYTWEGDCSFIKYDIYHDANNNGILDNDDVKCFKHCGIDWIRPEEDPDLCMQGLLIDNATVNKDGLYFFVIRLAGNVNMTPLTYGIFGGGYKEYDTVLSPVCPEEFCPVTCKDYPMKVSEVGLSGKCREF